MAIVTSAARGAPSPAPASTIPAFDSRGALPPGDHPATLPAVEQRYGVNAHRRSMLPGLTHAVAGLQAAGIEQAWLGGSFITDKPNPGDVDIAFAWKDGADVERLNTTISAGARENVQIFAADRVVMNTASLQNAQEGWRFLDLFRHNRAGEAVGVLRLDTSGRLD